MRNPLLLLLLASLLFIACKKRGQDTAFKLPPEKEVHAVIGAIIEQDSVPVLLTGRAQYPLSAELLDFKISLSESNAPPLMPGTGIRLKDLMVVKADSLGTSNLFAPEDSAYLIFLNSTRLKKRNTIKNLRADGIKVEALLNLEEELNEFPGKSTAFYIFSNPVFSEDQTRAYVELTFACNRLCGYGYAYSLKKQGDKWRIVNEETTYFE